MSSHTLKCLFFRCITTKLGQNLTCQWEHFAHGGTAVRYGFVPKLFLVDGQQVGNPVVQPHTQDELRKWMDNGTQKNEKVKIRQRPEQREPATPLGHPAGCVYLQNLNNLQLSVHHHHVFVVGQEVAFAIAQGHRHVREAVGHTTTHHHLSHHFTNSVDGTQDVVA